jgi:hypothetical protein
VIGTVAVVRSRMIEADQQRFDERYPVDGPT